MWAMIGTWLRRSKKSSQPEEPKKTHHNVEKRRITQLITQPDNSNIKMVTTNNSTGKRLLDEDIRTIFSCMSNNKSPPTKLDFSIIRIPQDSAKLSPPTFELENGLYVLMSKLAKVPSTLSDKLLSDSDLALLPSCPWSLSGPQHKSLNEGDLQQRYCYPRGKNCNGRGGAMWTMVDKKGHEDKDLRVLHIYDKHIGTKSSQPPKKKQAIMTQPEEPKKKEATTMVQQENALPRKKITHDRGSEGGLTIYYSTNKELKATLHHHQSSEQEKRIASLTQELKRAQARRAEEIDRCKLHVAQIEYLEASHEKDVQVYKDERASLEKEVGKVTSLTKQVQTMEKVVESFKLKQGDLAAELVNLRKSSWCDIKLKNEEVESLRQLLQTKDKEVESIQQKIKLKNEEISKLNESITGQAREEEECKRRNKEEIELLSQEHGRQLIEKKEQIHTLTLVADKLSEQKQSLTDLYDRLQTVYNILEEESSQEVQSLKAEVSALNSSIKNLQDENSSLAEKYKHDMTTLQEEKESNEVKIKQLTTHIEDQKKVNDDLQTEVNSLKTMQSDGEDTIKLLKKQQKAIAHEMGRKVKDLTIDNQSLAKINSSLLTQQNAMQERIHLLEKKLQQAVEQKRKESYSKHTAEDGIIDLLSSDDEEGDEALAMNSKVAAPSSSTSTTKKEEVKVNSTSSLKESSKDKSSSALSTDIGSQNDIGNLSPNPSPCNDKEAEDNNKQQTKKGTEVDTDALSDISNTQGTSTKASVSSPKQNVHARANNFSLSAVSNKTKTPKKKSTQEKGVTSVNEDDMDSLSLLETTSTKSSSPTNTNIGNSHNTMPSFTSKTSSPSATMNFNTDSLSSPIASCKRSTNTTTLNEESCEEYKNSEVHEDGSALGDCHLNSQSTNAFLPEPQLSSEYFENKEGQGTNAKPVDKGSSRKRRPPEKYSPPGTAQKKKRDTKRQEKGERSNTGKQAGETQINIKLGDIGYKFKKYFHSYQGWYDGEVVEILKDARYNIVYNRRCKYTDGDIEDYSLAEMRDTKKFKPRD